jgi:hypothetical protein
VVTVNGVKALVVNSLGVPSGPCSLHRACSDGRSTQAGGGRMGDDGERGRVGGDDDDGREGCCCM